MKLFFTAAPQICGLYFNHQIWVTIPIFAHFYFFAYILSNQCENTRCHWKVRLDNLTFIWHLTVYYHFKKNLYYVKKVDGRRIGGMERYCKYPLIINHLLSSICEKKSKIRIFREGHILWNLHPAFALCSASQK